MAAAAATAAATAAAEWYFLHDETDEQVGPLTVEELRATAPGGVSQTTLFWAEHLEEWTAVAEVGDSALQQALFPSALFPSSNPQRRKSKVSKTCKAPGCSEEHRYEDGFCAVHRSLAPKVYNEGHVGKETVLGAPTGS